MYLAGAGHVFLGNSKTRNYTQFLGFSFFFVVVAHFVVILTRSFCRTPADGPYENRENMVSNLQGTNRNAVQRVLFKNNTIVHSLEPSCNTVTGLDELHPMSVTCMPSELSTVDYNDGVLRSIVLVHGPSGPLHFL